MAKDAEIQERIDRVEAIIEQLESSEPSLDEGTELRDEARQQIREIRELLNRGCGTIVEIDE